MKTTIKILTLATLIAFSTGCRKEKWPCINGRGEVVTETRTTSLFTGIESDGDMDVFITQDETVHQATIVVEGEENLIENILTEVDGSTLKISFDRCVRNSHNVKIYITVANLEEIKLDGSGNIISENQLIVDHLDASVNGSGNIDLDLSAASVDFRINGSGNIDVQGTSTDLTVHITGSGNVEAFSFPVNTADVSISGSGNCEVNVTDILDVIITGSGSVLYKGNPQLYSKITGSGDVSQQN